MVLRHRVGNGHPECYVLNSLINQEYEKNGSDRWRQVEQNIVFIRI